MDSVEKIGKTVEDAVLEALRELHAEKDEVEITILETGTKGILGIGAKPAKVLVVKKHDPENAAKKFLKELCSAMGIVVSIETELTEKQLAIELKGDNMGILIGKRGQTLDSLQYLVNLVVNRGEGTYISVTLDTENYRVRRKETLEHLAVNIARKVKSSKRSVRLEPMNPYERRIIHSILQGEKSIATHSEGDEPFRYVVVTFKKY